MPLRDHTRSFKSRIFLSDIVYLAEIRAEFREWTLDTIVFSRGYDCISRINPRHYSVLHAYLFLNQYKADLSLMLF